MSSYRVIKRICDIVSQKNLPQKCQKCPFFGPFLVVFFWNRIGQKTIKTLISTSAHSLEENFPIRRTPGPLPRGGLDIIDSEK